MISLCAWWTIRCSSAAAPQVVTTRGSSSRNMRSATASVMCPASHACTDIHTEMATV